MPGKLFLNLAKTSSQRWFQELTGEILSARSKNFSVWQELKMQGCTKVQGKQGRGKVNQW